MVLAQALSGGCRHAVKTAVVIWRHHRVWFQAHMAVGRSPWFFSGFWTRASDPYRLGSPEICCGFTMVLPQSERLEGLREWARGWLRRKQLCPLQLDLEMTYHPFCSWLHRPSLVQCGRWGLPRLWITGSEVSCMPSGKPATTDPSLAWAAQ